MNQTDRKGKIPHGSNPTEILQETYESKEALACREALALAKDLGWRLIARRW
jgi:hypothetical protein